MDIFKVDRKWTMEEKVDRFGNLFQSERLIYESVEEDDNDTTDFLLEMFKDTTLRGLSEFGMIKPTNKKKVKEFTTYLSTKSTLGMLICLPPDENTKVEDGKEPKPQPIGFISLDPKWEKGLQVGLCVSKDHQNKGYGREAINWALDWAFLWGGAHRVSIGTIAFNDRAAKLYESIGFVAEGPLRSAAWSDGGWHDVLQFSILDHEYKKLRNIG